VDMDMVYSLSITTTIYHYERSIPCKKIAKNLTLLAQNLLFKICAKLIDFIKKIITSPEFIERNRYSHKNFTRQRKLPFHVLIVFLINFVRGSYQDELDKFFKSINRFDVAQRVVSKVALAKARMKLKFEAFVELNQHLVNYFEKHFQPITWHGFRLLAIDGSTTRLPHIKAIADHFGVWRVRKGKPSPMARVSQLFDVLNKTTIDALIYPKRSGERQLAAQHLLKAMPGDLILLDRGYPAWWLFSLILSMDTHFCARISCTKWKAVRKFFCSGLAEKIISLPIHSSSMEYCNEMGLSMKPLKLRLIRIQNKDQVQVLITSLIDTKEYPIEIFRDLYHHRWPVEEDYKTIKCRLELENFSGKSVLSVYQDFHAKIFTKNLVWIMAFPANNALRRKSKSRKYDYQINFTQALSKSKGVIGLLFHETVSKILHLIAELQNIFQRTIEPIRPGRKYPRNHKVSRRKFFPAYKPIG
jgi:hypothetical protein